MISKWQEMNTKTKRKGIWRLDMCIFYVLIRDVPEKTLYEGGGKESVPPSVFLSILAFFLYRKSDYYRSASIRICYRSNMPCIYQSVWPQKLPLPDHLVLQHQVEDNRSTLCWPAQKCPSSVLISSPQLSFVSGWGYRAALPPSLPALLPMNPAVDLHTSHRC